MITGKFDETLLRTKQQRLYLYTNHPQIAEQTGYIGYLRGTFEKDDNSNILHMEFFPAETPLRYEFVEAFTSVMETLRAGILKSYKSMKDFCSGDGFDGRFYGDWAEEFAFRIDNAEFSFLFRLIPMRGDYNVYCYCYRSHFLDRHMARAMARGIRFTLFTLEDGESIKIEIPGREPREAVCRYIDETHVLVGADIFHIFEFAERIAALGGKVSQVKKDA